MEHLPTRTKNALAKKRIITNDDMARWVPRAYRDYRRIVPIDDTEEGSYVTVCGVLESIEKRMGQHGYYMVARLHEEETGTRFRVMFFSRIYQFGHFQLMENSPVVVCGKVHHDFSFGASITEPDFFLERRNFSPFIHPIYSKIKGVSDATRQSLIQDAVGQSEEVIEPAVLDGSGLPSYPDALRMLHFPTSANDIRAGRKRLLFNDLLFFSMLLQKENGQQKAGTPFWFKEQEKTRSFLAGLSFSLTEDQERVVSDIIGKAASGLRNNVLLQGDVGCGKTIVAAAAMMCAAENGYQSVLVAPRFVLASQHFAEFNKYAEEAGLSAVFLHAGLKAKEKKAFFERISAGEVSFIVGTHSCLSDSVPYKNLGLIVTDEEHLFGVEQKEALARRAEDGVHQISMSATPIPRTIATALYGESKTIASIKTMPKGRLPVKSAAISDRPKALAFMEQEIAKGHQCYVVCPLIDENEEIEATSVAEAEQIYRSYFEKRGILVGVVTGQMSEDDAAKQIQAFASGQTKVLLSTTVIEVGVNVPKATVMVIEQAERFGLASLHQLRGRVGRSDAQSYCILLTDSTEHPRIEAILSTTDGFAIAEADLSMRGAGNLIGTEQSGMNRYVNLMLDHPQFYEAVKERAAFALQHGFCRRLIEMYKASGRA